MISAGAGHTAGNDLSTLRDVLTQTGHVLAGQSSYAAAKEGIRGMTRVAATEWGPDGVRANCICPLAMTEQLAAWKEAYPDTFAATIKGIPLGRFGDPKTDIGGVAVFLASDLSAYVSGETITVQGGSGLRP